MKLGRLEKIDLRSIWLSEGRDFTPWLALPENLEILSEAINIDLEFEAQEKDVGPFRADILCKDTANGTWVLIENQIERTDHRHLGQLLTYAAGLQAVSIVWIASQFTDEHRAALDWLNQVTSDNIKFFGLEVELWRIGSSDPAPRFNVVARPNDWSEDVRHAAETIGRDPNTETKALQLKFWTNFSEFLKSKQTKIRSQKPLPQHWYNFAIGRSGAVISARLNTRTNNIGIELILNGNDSKEIFQRLILQKDIIETEIGSNVEWKDLEENKRSSILLLQSADPKNEQDWPNQFNWLMQKLELFDHVFRNRLRLIA